MLQYCEDLPSEAARNLACDKNIINWPDQGKLQFNDVNYRYKENGPLALNHITFNVNPGEAVGVVGRTGSGKSTLMSALLRLIEVEKPGSISIDGVDIASLGLYKLRESISVIPQETTAFEGTIRYNLTGPHSYTDNQVWEALAAVSTHTI